MSYSEIRCEKEYEKAMALAKGCYQEAILNGTEAISGATLRGKAKSYGSKYRTSSCNLLERCRKEGIEIDVQFRKHGKLVVVIGLTELEREERRIRAAQFEALKRSLAHQHELEARAYLAGKQMRDAKELAIQDKMHNTIFG